MSVLSYWTAFFITITFEEHVIFRRPSGPLGGYDLDAYDSPSRLPLGVAGILAGCCGVAGAVVGMAQVYYTGPIAKHTGDIGFEMAFTVTAILYVLLRTLEIRILGR